MIGRSNPVLGISCKARGHAPQRPERAFTAKASSQHPLHDVNEREEPFAGSKMKNRAAVLVEDKDQFRPGIR